VKEKEEVRENIVIANKRSRFLMLFLSLFLNMCNDFVIFLYTNDLKNDKSKEVDKLQ
jgi:hypothetical protein